MKPKTVNPNTITPPRKGRPLREYVEYMLDLHKQALGYNRSLGRLSWLQGRALVEARKSCTKRGQWKDFCISIEMNPKTAYLLRRVGELIPEERSYTLEYSQMLEIVFPSFKKQLLEESKQDNTKGRKGTTQPKKNSEKSISFGQLTSFVSSLATNARKIASCRHLDGTMPPDKIASTLQHLLMLIEQTQRDLKRIESKVSTRLAKNRGIKTLRKAG